MTTELAATIGAVITLGSTCVGLAIRSLLRQIDKLYVAWEKSEERGDTWARMYEDCVNRRRPSRPRPSGPKL